MITPPPIPVPSATKTRWSASLPTPNRNSPHAAALPSFSIVRGSPIFGSSSSFRGIPSIGVQVRGEDDLVLLGEDQTGHGEAHPSDLGPVPDL